jgi:hypothetical protein
MTDTERLDWLTETGMSLINDDFGNWAVTSDGMQNVPKNPPDDIETTFFIEKAQWRPSVREAIDAAKEDWEKDDAPGNPETSI